MHMKKIAFALVAALLCLALFSGCGQAVDPTDPSETSAPMPSTTAEPDTITSEPETFTATTSNPSTTTITSKPTATAASEPVILTPAQAVYPVDTEEITVTWTNGSNEDMLCGDSFHLQAWTSGKWTEVEPINQLMFLLRAYMLKPGESQDILYDIGHYYGRLEAGRYRIAASFLYDAERPINKNTPEHHVYAEFEIK